MNSLNRVIVYVAAILGISAIIATSIVTSTYYRVKMNDNNISVAGTAQKMVTSDSATWSATFSRSVAPYDLKGGSALLKNDLATVIGYLHDKGITDQEITVQPVNRYQVCAINTKYGGQDCTGKGLLSYTMEQAIYIESSNVNAITALSQNSTDDLTNKGIFFSSNYPSYFYSKIDDLRIELTSDATKNAFTRAQKIAESTGAHVGLLQSADVSVIQITGKNSADISDYGSYDTSSVDKKVSLVVHATFGLR